MGEFVYLEVADGIGTIRLNRPKVNALNDQVTAELAEAARGAAASDDVRAVIVYGGEKVFCGGADIEVMAEAGYAEMALRSGRLQEAAGLVAALPKPVVAAITGYALGGGLELALAADFRVAGERARVGQPEILLGVIPGAGGTQRLSRLIGPARAKDIVFSGRMVGAAEALQIGLVDQVVPDDSVYQAALDMVRRYASGPALALRAAGPGAAERRGSRRRAARGQGGHRLRARRGPGHRPGDRAGAVRRAVRHRGPEGRHAQLPGKRPRPSHLHRPLTRSVFPGPAPRPHPASSCARLVCRRGPAQLRLHSVQFMIPKGLVLSGVPDPSGSSKSAPK
jgi:enoyl-CoA hydratase/carnithine racemase